MGENVLKSDNKRIKYKKKILIMNYILEKGICYGRFTQLFNSTQL